MNSLRSTLLFGRLCRVAGRTGRHQAGFRVSAGVRSATASVSATERSAARLVAAGIVLGAPLAAIGLIVQGTTVGKIYRGGEEAAAKFLMRESQVAHTTFAALKSEVLRLVDGEGRARRYNFEPGKAGSAIGYDELLRASPAIVDFFKKTASQVSEILRMRVVPTPEGDKSSLSVLVYDKEGDHIDWHYDLNFYEGRHFTVLVPILVEAGVDAQLQVVVPDGGEFVFPSSSSEERVRFPSASQITVEAILGSRFAREEGNEYPGSKVETVPVNEGKMIVFEGDCVFHRVTPLGRIGAALSWSSTTYPAASDRLVTPRRIILSMTFCTDPTISPLNECQRRLKDMVYFGPLQALLG
jgi:hypothetical protein